MTFDIRSIAINQTATMPVRDVDGNVQTDADGNEISITFYGPGSRQFMAAKHELETAAREKYAKAKKTANGVAKTDPEDLSRKIADFLAAVTVSLNGFDYPGGPRALYMDPELGHIANEADLFVSERGNFKKNSEEV